MHCIVYTDGGSRGNPGPAGYGVVIKNHDGSSIGKFYHFLGKTTNNVAEYEGVKRGIAEAIRAGAESIDLRADSELIVRQLSGVYKVRNADLFRIFSEIRAMIADWGGKITFTHVYREANKEADTLANRAMDEEMGK